MTLTTTLEDHFDTAAGGAVYQGECGAGSPGTMAARAGAIDAGLAAA